MRRRRGYTLIELVLVLLLLVLVASAVFSLARAGSQAYLRLTAKQDQAADLRTGLSYIDVQVRRHDVRQAIAVQPDPFAGKPALAIRQEIDGEPYVTWIYLYDGYLCELLAAENAAIQPEMGSRIAPANELELQAVDGGALRVTLRRQAEGQARIEGSRTIYLNAGGISP